MDGQAELSLSIPVSKDPEDPPERTDPNGKRRDLSRKTQVWSNPDKQNSEILQCHVGLEKRTVIQLIS